MVQLSSKLAVLHLALNPVTGVWSVMRELARAQTRAGLYAAVGIGIIADRRWPELCRTELENSGLPHYLGSTPKMFGTAQDLWQRVKPPPLARWLDDMAARSGADCCVAHFHNAWISGVFLPLRRAQRDGTRAVATFHGVNGHFRRQPIRQWLHQWMAARLTKYGAVLTSVDHANLSRAQLLLGMRPERFQVVPNGITDTTVRGCPYLKGAAVFTVGHVGSIIPAKGWRIVVKAARKLRDAGVSINVVLAGRGSDAEQARELAESSGGWLSYKGFVANPRETVMKKLDALVLMSEQEGLPMAIIEALSIGLPVIATPVGGVPEALTDGKTGFLIPRSTDELVKVLGRLADDRELLRALSDQARLDFEERFEVSKVVARYHSVYEGGA